MAVIAMIAVAGIGIGGYAIMSNDNGQQSGGTNGGGNTPVFTDKDFRWNATVEEVWTGGSVPAIVVRLVYYCPEDSGPGYMDLMAGERKLKGDIWPYPGTHYLKISAGTLPVNEADIILYEGLSPLAKDPSMPTVES